MRSDLKDSVGSVYDWAQFRLHVENLSSLSPELTTKNVIKDYN